MTKISVKKALLIVFSIAILGLSLVFYLTNNKEDLSKYVTVLVEKGDLVQIVSETGVVKVVDKVDLSFEEALVMLEAVVSELESGDLSLEASLELFERGVRLSRRCRELLLGARQRVDLLTEEGVVGFEEDE